jgi:leucyl aminopeptidase
MLRKITINQNLALPTTTVVDRFGGLVVLYAKSPSLKQAPYGDVLHKRRRSENFATELPNRMGTRASVVEIAPTSSAFELLTLGRKIAAQQYVTDPKEIGIVVVGLDPALATRAVEATVAGLLAARQPLPSFKKETEAVKALGTLHLFGLRAKLDLARTEAEAEGNFLARSLTALPANKLTPRLYRQKIAALARREGWEFKFYGTTALKRLGAGAFLAVAQGSPEDDAGIVHLRYTPKGARNAPRVGLVGKGICFDTGGMNLKPARHMHGMHQDMAGSAAVLGILLALTRLRANVPVDAWLALAQNHIGPAAYKQNDVVTAMNGTTIEVIHTDAEGRMVLADTLALASAKKPQLLIDFATLTGSCIGALGTAYSGVLSNRDEFVPELIQAGRASGERVWPFPMDADFDTQLESEVADIKQCTLENDADHILGARFLGRFVEPDVPWVHVDIASSAHKGGLAHIPTEITGFGVRLGLQLLLDARLAKG